MSYQVSQHELKRLFPAGWAARDNQLLRGALLDWCVIVLCWYVMSLSDHWLLYGAGVCVIAGRLHALGVILHDACHQPTRKRTVKTWLVEALSGWSIGSTVAAMRYHHLRHHRRAGMPDDPYLHPILRKGKVARVLMTLRGAMLSIWWPLRAFVGPIALLVPSIRNFYGRGFLQDRSGADLTHHPELITCLKHDVPQALAHAMVAAVVVWLDLPFFTHYFVPWMVGGIINARRVIIEHTHHEPADLSANSVWATTLSHGQHWWQQLVLYPHNIGFHQAHHLYPSVAFQHLPKLHLALRTAFD